jgi:hypothetical protein
VRQPFENGDGWILQTAFEAAYVGAIDRGIDGKSFLGKASTDPESTEIPGHQCAGVHAQTPTGSGLLNHGV